MPVVQQLGLRRSVEALTEALRRQTPVFIDFRVGPEWYHGRSRIIQCKDDKLYLAYPELEKDPAPELKQELAIGISFKIKHHKHVCNVVVEDIGSFKLDDESEVRTLRVSIPRRMQRIQRRAYQRVEIPRNRSALATFWPGGMLAKPARRHEADLTWDGWVTNISAGGLQVRTASQRAPQMEEGDVVGVRIELSQEHGPIVADALFRRRESDDRGVTLMGFQFVGLDQHGEGHDTLLRISKIVREFQRFQGRRRADTVA